MRRLGVCFFALLTSFVFALNGPLTAQDLPAEVEALFERINSFRSERGVPPLKLDQRLCQAASLHSQEMVRESYFGHVSPNIQRQSPSKRAVLAGYRWWEIYENIYRSRARDVQTLVQDTMRTWIDSDIHRENLLATKARDLGIGTAVNGQGEILITVMLAKPK